MQVRQDTMLGSPYCKSRLGSLQTGFERIRDLQKTQAEKEEMAVCFEPEKLSERRESKIGMLRNVFALLG